jgi:hypothetical protein
MAVVQPAGPAAARSPEASEEISQGQRPAENRSHYSSTQRPFARISSYMASGAKSAPLGH